MIELVFSPGALERHGLPNIPYPVPTEVFSQAIEDQGIMPFAAMLHGLQEHCAAGDADWQSLEPALDRLAELVTPADDREIISAAGHNWWVEIGPVNLDEPIVTIQRLDFLIAALAKRDDGRLRLATFRPLDGKSARYITGLCLQPHPETGAVCMRENNWAYALDCSAGAGNWYASDRGEAHLSFWERGIGLLHDGFVDDEWQAMRSLPQRPPARVAMELGVAYAFSDERSQWP